MRNEHIRFASGKLEAAKNTAIRDAENTKGNKREIEQLFSEVSEWLASIEDQYDLSTPEGIDSLCDAVDDLIRKMQPRFEGAFRSKGAGKFAWLPLKQIVTQIRGAARNALIEDIVEKIGDPEATQYVAPEEPEFDWKADAAKWAKLAQEQVTDSVEPVIPDELDDDFATEETEVVPRLSVADEMAQMTPEERAEFALLEKDAELAEAREQMEALRLELQQMREDAEIALSLATLAESETVNTSQVEAPEPQVYTETPEWLETLTDRAEAEEVAYEELMNATEDEPDEYVTRAELVRLHEGAQADLQSANTEYGIAHLQLQVLQADLQTARQEVSRLTRAKVNLESTARVNERRLAETIRHYNQELVDLRKGFRFTADRERSQAEAQREELQEDHQAAVARLQAEHAAAVQSLRTDYIAQLEAMQQQLTQASTSIDNMSVAWMQDEAELTAVMDMMAKEHRVQVEKLEAAHREAMQEQAEDYDEQVNTWFETASRLEQDLADINEEQIAVLENRIEELTQEQQELKKKAVQDVEAAKTEVRNIQAQLAEVQKNNQDDRVAELEQRLQIAQRELQEQDGYLVDESLKQRLQDRLEDAQEVRTDLGDITVELTQWMNEVRQLTGRALLTREATTVDPEQQREIASMKEWLDAVEGVIAAHIQRMSALHESFSGEIHSMEAYLQAMSLLEQAPPVAELPEVDIDALDIQLPSTGAIVDIATGKADGQAIHMTYDSLPPMNGGTVQVEKPTLETTEVGDRIVIEGLPFELSYTPEQEAQVRAIEAVLQDVQDTKPRTLRNRISPSSTTKLVVKRYRAFYEAAKNGEVVSKIKGSMLLAAIMMNDATGIKEFNTRALAAMVTKKTGPYEDNPQNRIRADFPGLMGDISKSFTWCEWINGRKKDYELPLLVGRTKDTFGKMNHLTPEGKIAAKVWLADALRNGDITAEDVHNIFVNIANVKPTEFKK